MADGNVTENATGVETDAELIRGLQEALAVEQAKNQVLMEQLMKAEDALADKDLEGYADIVEEADRPFWRRQLLENRESAVGVLERMRGRTKSGVAEGGGGRHCWRAAGRWCRSGRRRTRCWRGSRR